MAVVVLMAGTGALRWVPEDGNALSWILGAGSALLIFAVPAAAEEAMLRGYPLQALAEAWGSPRAVGATAVAFGLLHMWNPGVGWLETVNVGLAGLLLGVVYVRTLSLWWATGVHLGWNWSHGYAADVSVSGLDVVDAPLYQGVVSGPGWLSGGAFGPEGTLAATVILTGAAAACWWGPWLRPGAAARAAGSLVSDEIRQEV
jgi:membrane protease YdiL (CAAX protease family)